MKKVRNSKKERGVVKQAALSPFDDIECWLDGTQFYNPPESPEWIAAFQKRIDDTFGRGREGASIIKLVWNGDRKYWHEYFCDWNALGRGTKRERRPRILWKCPRVNKEDYVDMFPPRFLLLARMEPEQYAAQWQHESFMWDARMKVNKEIRDSVAPPVFYENYKTICHHDNYCCGLAEKNGENCFGRYRPPSEIDLIELGELKGTLNAQKHLQSPYENLSEHTKNAVALWTRDFYREQYRMTESTAQIIIENATGFLAPLMASRGIKMSESEQHNAVKSAVAAVKEEREREAELFYK